ncbi:unnamed protein product [Camellia sinensis]
MAYDSASIKLRIGDNRRHFPWTNITLHEPKFQSFHSTEAILNMIRDGSYPSKFADFMRSQMGEHEIGHKLMRMHGHAGFSCKLLFQKELTPSDQGRPCPKAGPHGLRAGPASDVSKLNRLVVPKRYAVKHFPPVVENTEENTGGGKLDEVHLFFYDRLMRLWKFRYCYWKSSQSFVFTKGWNRFVKEKELKANDVIAFYVCEGQERAKEAQAFCVIDIGYNGGSRNDRVVEGIGQNVDMQLDLCRGLRQYFDCKSFNEEKKRVWGSKGDYRTGGSTKCEKKCCNINDLVQEAHTQWLKPAEVLFILQNYKEEQLTNEPPRKPAIDLFFFLTRGSFHISAKMVIAGVERTIGEPLMKRMSGSRMKQMKKEEGKKERREEEAEADNGGGGGRGRTSCDDRRSATIGRATMIGGAATIGRSAGMQGPL